MKRRNVTILAIIMAMLMVLALGSCGPATEEEPDDPEEPIVTDDDDDDDEPQPGGTLRIAVSGDPVALDPHLQADWSTRQSIAYMFDGLTLMGADPDTGEEEIWPSLARDWDISEDGLTYVLYLRDDVLFHDGTRFDAEAVKFNYDRYLDPEFNSPEHPHIVDRLESVEVIDEFTVQMNMSRVDIFWLSSMSALYMVSPTAVQEMGDEGHARHPVGTGPFKFESYAADSHVEMVRFDDHWRGAPLLDGLRVRIIPEDSTQHLELEAGDIDLAYNYAITPADVDRLEDAGIVVERRLTPSNAMLAMNLADGPTTDLLVRRAIAHSIDRDLIIEEILLGAAEKSNVGLPPISPIYPDHLPLIEYDPVKAGELLDQAGWELGDDGIRYKDGEPLELRILTSDREERVLMSQILHEQLEDVGFQADMTTLEWGAYLDACRSGDYDVTYWILYGSVWTNYTASSNIRSGRHWNIFQIEHQPDLVEQMERIDYLLDTFGETMDEDKRVELITEYQDIMREHMIMFFLWNEANFNAVQPEIKDYHLYNYNLFFLQDAWIDR